MDYETIELINQARIHMANRDIDKLISIISSLPTIFLMGTLFDIPSSNINEDYLALYINELRRKKGIKDLCQKDFDILFKKDSGFYLDENELLDIFESIKNNIVMFDRRYNQKIFGVNTSQENTFHIGLEQSNLFHILGFDTYKWDKHDKEEMAKIFPIYNSIIKKGIKNIKINNKELFFDLLLSILSKRDILIDRVLSGDNKVNKAINFHKVKIKNLLFEKSDFTASPSGIIHCTPKEESCIKSNLFLLRDFINKGNQEWLYFAFRDERKMKHKISESLLLNYLNERDLQGKQIDYITSIDVYDKESFPKKEAKSRIEFNEYELQYLKYKLFGEYPIEESKTKIKIH